MQTNSLIKMYLEEHKRICDEFPIEKTTLLFNAILTTYRIGGRVFCFGNGGGFSVAEHFYSDLMEHPFVAEDKHGALEIQPLEVRCLGLSGGLLTRIANDLKFINIFLRELRSCKPKKEDTIIAFSGSGNSKNVVNTLMYAKSKGATTALVGGRDGGKAGGIADICILVPGTSQFPGQVGKNDNCFHIEDFQGSVAHMMAGLLKEAICKS